MYLQVIELLRSSYPRKLKLINSKVLFHWSSWRNSRNQFVDSCFFSPWIIIYSFCSERIIIKGSVEKRQFCKKINVLTFAWTDREVSGQAFSIKCSPDRSDLSSVWFVLASQFKTTHNNTNKRFLFLLLLWHQLSVGVPLAALCSLFRSHICLQFSARIN